jgi:hypothetical protein
MREQLLKRDLGELGINLVLQFGENFGERRIPSQFPCLDELAGQQRREGLTVRPKVKTVVDLTGISCPARRVPTAPEAITTPSLKTAAASAGRSNSFK